VFSSVVHVGDSTRLRNEMRSLPNIRAYQDPVCRREIWPIAATSPAAFMAGSCILYAETGVTSDEEAALECRHPVNPTPPATPFDEMRPQMESTQPATFLVALVFDLEGRDGLLVSGKTLDGKVRKGMTLENDSRQRAQVLQLEFLSPRDVAEGEVTILLERTDPSPARPQATLRAVAPGS
jgi:hypothetical protein